MLIESIRKELDYIKCDMWLDTPDEIEDEDLIFHKSFILDEIDNLLAELQACGMK